MAKRKRNDLPDTLHSRPPKRADSEAAKPFTFYFSSNFDFSLDPNFTSQVFSHKENKSQHIIRSSTHSAEFVGKTYSDDFDDPLPCRYAIGIVDKDTGKMRMMETEEGHLVCMHSWTPYTEEQRIREEQAAELGMKHAKMLQEQFNNEKKKRKQASKDKGDVAKIEMAEFNGAPAAERAMMVSLGQQREVIHDPSQEEMRRRAEARRIIPPHHPDATKPFDAYRLEELISPGANRALQYAVKQLQQGIDDDEFREGILRANFMLPEYILDKLVYMKNMVSETFQRRLKHLALLGAFINMYGAPKTIRNETKRAGGLDKMSKRLNIPVPMLEFFLKQFYTCDREGTLEVWVFPGNRERFMFLYILVLAVLAEDGDMPAESLHKLATSWKFHNPQEVTEKYRELGCECNKAKITVKGMTVSSYSVSLLPAKARTHKTLQECFPALKLGGRGRK